MVTNTNIRHKEANTQAERIPIFCEKTGKLLARIDATSVAQLESVQGGLWCWCRNCHCEHHILWKDLTPKGSDEK